MKKKERKKKEGKEAGREEGIMNEGNEEGIRKRKEHKSGKKEGRKVENNVTDTICSNGGSIIILETKVGKEERWKETGKEIMVVIQCRVQ